MKIIIKYIFAILSFIVFCSTSCKSTNTSLQKSNAIFKACDLVKRINDTIVVSGIYSECMEYSSFNLLENDECTDEFDMDLGFNQARFTEKIETRLDEMYGCGVSLRLTIKGILRKEKGVYYGHLGSNTAEFDVLEFIDFGKVKFKKLNN